jgi:hypothetical protein
MQDRIADELMRGDLTSQIALAINSAISTYQKERFRFNETSTTTFVTNVGQQFYNADNTTFSDIHYPGVVLSPRTFYSIEHLLITVPPAVFDMTRIQPAQMLTLSQTGTQMGQPYHWSYDNETISLYPVPSSGGPGQINSFTFTGGAGYSTGVYPNSPLSGGSGTAATATITVSAGVVTAVQVNNPGTRYVPGDVLSSISIGPGAGFTLTVSAIFTGATGPYLMTILGQLQLPGPTDPNDVTNRWMLDGERLIRSRAKYELALHVTRNAMMAQMMSPEEPGGGALPGASYAAYRELKVEAVRMQRRGVIAPMYF